MKEENIIKIRLITVIFISFLGIIIKPVDFKDITIGYTVIIIAYLLTLLCIFTFLVLNLDNYSKEFDIFKERTYINKNRPAGFYKC